MKKLVTSGLELLGIATISTGCGLFDYRAGLIAAGFGLIAVSIGAAR